MDQSKDSPAVRPLLAILTIAWLGYAAKHGVLDRPAFAALCCAIGGAVLAGLVAVSRWPAIDGVVGRAGLLLSLVGVSALCWFSGQGLAGGIWFLVFIPVLAATAFPRDPIWPWAAASAGAVATLWIGGVFAPQPSIFVVEGRELLVTQATLIAMTAWALADFRRRIAQERTIRNRREEDLAAEKQAANDRAFELGQARRQLEDALSAREAFLARMSHEVRTPLNGILGLAQLLADPGSGMSRERVARDISSSGRTLLGLLNNILDVSKMRSGAFELAPRPFDLHELVESVVQVFSGDAWAKDIDLAYVFDADVPPRVVADPVRLQQVLNNLLGNALRHTESGSIAIRTSVAGQGHSLLLSVTDSGPGIRDGDKERIFGAFARGSEDSTSGTGLGLALVQEIVTRMGGRVWVDDAPHGLGAVFHVEVPLSAAESQPSAPLPGLPQTVLLAEPHALTAQSLTCRLQAAGVTVLEPLSPEDLRTAWWGRAWEVAIVCPEFAQEQGLLDKPVNRPWLAIQRTPMPPEIESNDLIGRVLSPVQSRGLWSSLRTALSDAAEPTNPFQVIAVTGEAVQRVLVAEDDPTSRSVMELLLGRMGHQVTLAVDGLEAVQLARNGPFDVVILDREMPRMNGIAAAREIRQLLPDARVAMVTASFTALQRAELADIGVHDVLQKPVHLAELMVIFDRAPSQTERPTPSELPPDPAHKDIADALVYLEGLLGERATVLEMAREWVTWIESQHVDAAAGLEDASLRPTRALAHAVAGSVGRFGGESLERDARTLLRLATDDPQSALTRAPAFVQACQDFCRALAGALDDMNREEAP